MRDNIPLDIFKVIQQYLNKYDYRQLLNTNSSIFQHVKYETVYYNLRIINWKEIKTIEERNRVIDYLSILYGLVKDKKKQISLKISGFVEECTNFMSGIHNLIYINDDNHRKISNMSLFINLCYLSLSKINHIDHLSGLSGLKILHLSYCNDLRTIDFIPQLKRLCIDSLPNLLEISKYGNIPELYISDCPNLNLRGLGNHRRFYIDDSNNMIVEIDLSILQNVQSLTIFSFHRKPLKGLDKKDLPSFTKLTHLSIDCSNRYFHVSSFPNLRYLKLNDAEIGSKVLFPSQLVAEFNACVFDDVSVLSKSKELIFYCCKGRGFNNVDSLSNAYKLVFSYNQELKNVSGLDKVHDLRIQFCKKVKDLSKLGRVHRLCVENCGVTSLTGLGEGNSEIALSSLPKVIDFSQLRFVYKVTIEKCGILVDGRGLSDVKILGIVGCFNFTDTSSLGKVERLYLIACSRIERLVGLENVPHIHLEDCNKLHDIDCLGKQQSLVIKDCPKLKQLMKKDLTGKYDRLFEGIKTVRIDPESLSWKFSPSLTRALPLYFSTGFSFEEEY